MTIILHAFDVDGRCILCISVLLSIAIDIVRGVLSQIGWSMIVDMSLHKALLALGALQNLFLVRSERYRMHLELVTGYNFKTVLCIHVAYDLIRLQLQLLLLMLDVGQDRLVCLSRLCQHLQVVCH